MEKIVVTGATSMLGVALLEEALKNDIGHIYAVVRPNSNNLYRMPQSEKISIIEAKMEEYKYLSSMINDECDVFYHFAWKETGPNRNESALSQSENIGITLHALHAASEVGCKKFVGTGSQAEYGLLDIEKIAPDSQTNPIQNYGIAKYAAGKLAMNEAEKLGITCLWVRVFSVYGKYDKPTTMISSSVQKMLNGEATAFTAGEQRWDYLYSEDAGRAFYLIGEKAIESKVYCLGSGHARKLKEYIQIMNDTINPKINPGIGLVAYGKNTVMNLCADVSELTKDTGWTPIVEFEEGIKKFLKNQYLDIN